MPTVGTGKNKRKYAYTVEGLKQAEIAARNTNQRVDIDRSVYGPTNTNPNMNPDSDTKLVEPNPPSLANKRTNTLRRKADRPHKAKRNLY